RAMRREMLLPMRSVPRGSTELFIPRRAIPAARVSSRSCRTRSNRGRKAPSFVWCGPESRGRGGRPVLEPSTRAAPRRSRLVAGVPGIRDAAAQVANEASADYTVPFATDLVEIAPADHFDDR